MRRVLPKSFGTLAVGLTLAFAGGCSSMHEYDDVVHNRNRCNPCEGKPWDLYRDLSSPCNPCQDAGACGCAPAATSCAPARAPSVEAFPAGAKPGEAWCRVVTPARYETIREPVTTVCGSVEREWVPPVLQTRFHTVCVSPASDEVIRTPGVTRTDVMCAEECPARTETRSVCVEGPCGATTSCETVKIPATTTTRMREVCIRAPERHDVHEPAQYVKEPCLVEVEPGRWVDRPVAPVVEMRTRVVCVSPERVEWRRNPTCEVPAVPSSSPCAPAAKK